MTKEEFKPGFYRVTDDVGSELSTRQISFVREIDTTSEFPYVSKLNWKYGERLTNEEVMQLHGIEMPKCEPSTMPFELIIAGLCLSAMNANPCFDFSKATHHELIMSSLHDAKALLEEFEKRQ